MLQALLELCRNQQKHLVHSVKTQTWRFIISLQKVPGQSPAAAGGAVTPDSRPPRWARRGQSPSPWGSAGQGRHTGAHTGWGLRPTPAVLSPWATFCCHWEVRFYGERMGQPWHKGLYGINAGSCFPSRQDQDTPWEPSWNLRCFALQSSFKTKCWSRYWRSYSKYYNPTRISAGYGHGYLTLPEQHQKRG